MQERIKELLAEALAPRGSSTAARCEQALALSTLASFLSYLSFGAPSCHVSIDSVCCATEISLLALL